MIAVGHAAFSLWLAGVIPLAKEGSPVALVNVCVVDTPIYVSDLSKLEDGFKLSVMGA